MESTNQIQKLIELLRELPTTEKLDELLECATSAKIEHEELIKKFTILEKERRKSMESVEVLKKALETYQLQAIDLVKSRYA